MQRGQLAFHDVEIRTADAACQHAQQNLSWGRLGIPEFSHPKWPIAD